MQDTTLFETILGLQAPWHIARVALDTSGERVEIWVEHAAAARWACPECAQAAPGHDHAEERVWRCKEVGPVAPEVRERRVEILRGEWPCVLAGERLGELALERSEGQWRVGCVRDARIEVRRAQEPRIDFELRLERECRHRPGRKLARLEYEPDRSIATSWGT